MEKCLDYRYSFSLFLVGRKENSQQISSCLYSVAKFVSKNKKVHMIMAQYPINNSIMWLVPTFSSIFEFDRTRVCCSICNIVFISYTISENYISMLKDHFSRDILKLILLSLQEESYCYFQS